jgi:bifunctional DNase/RNase
VSDVDEAPRDIAEPEVPAATDVEPEVAADASLESEVTSDGSVEIAAESDDGAGSTEASGSTEGVDEEPLGFSLPKPMSKMLFVDVVLVLPSTHPVVVLQEADFPYRELRIPIGGPEGIAIGYASRRLATPRPLTHEFMTRLMESFGLTLDVVHITGLQGGMFTAEITVSGPTGQRVLDCRPSDGIALALRQTISVPIMADPDVLDRAAGAAAGSN